MAQGVLVRRGRNGYSVGKMRSNSRQRHDSGSGRLGFGITCTGAGNYLDDVGPLEADRAAHPGDGIDDEAEAESHLSSIAAAVTLNLAAVL